jgi:hypothetical protein
MVRCDVHICKVCADSYDNGDVVGVRDEGPGEWKDDEVGSAAEVESGEESGDQQALHTVGDSSSEEEQKPKKKASRKASPRAAKKEKGSSSGDDSSSEEEQKPKKEASRKASPKAAPKKKQSCSDDESPSEEEQPDNGGAEEVPAHNNPPLYPQRSTMLNASVQVEEILDQRMSKKDGEKREFKIRWKGYGPKEDTWEIEDNLHCEDLLNAFWEKRRVALDGTLAPHSEDNESDDDEPEVAGHSADVLPAEELSIVQVVEIELSKEQVDKLERR